MLAVWVWLIVSEINQLDWLIAARDKLTCRAPVGYGGHLIFLLLLTLFVFCAVIWRSKLRIGRVYTAGGRRSTRSWQSGSWAGQHESRDDQWWRGWPWRDSAVTWRSQLTAHTAGASHRRPQRRRERCHAPAAECRQYWPTCRGLYWTRCIMHTSSVAAE